MSRRAQDERDRVLGDRIRVVVRKRALSHEHVAELALERRRAADTLAAERLEAVAGTLTDEFHHAAACRSGAADAGQDWPDAPGDCDAEPLAPASPDIVRDLMLLANANVPLEVVETWTSEQRESAERWAVAVHLNASDHHDVEVPPMPEHVRAGRAVAS